MYKKGDKLSLDPSMRGWVECLFRAIRARLPFYNLISELVNYLYRVVSRSSVSLLKEGLKEVIIVFVNCDIK